MVVRMRFGRRRRDAAATRISSGDDPVADAIVARVHQVGWAHLNHAYGPAGDVAAELEALTLGDEAERQAAWWELWGNVHHQGTVYEATVPAVEVIADLAAWTEFPDRREALHMLSAFVEGSGDHAPAVAAAVRARATGLVAGWRHQPQQVQRALLLFSRSAQAVDDEMLQSVLPERYRAVWSLGTSAEIWANHGNEQPDDQGELQDFDAAMDALSELEDWAFDQG
jgi:hypothetical protein